MIRVSFLLWLILIAGAGTALYQLKYKVIALEDQLAEIEGDISADRDAIAMLYAEWSYLNDPAQIEAFATNHLGTRPTTVHDIVALSDIPMAPDFTGTAARARPGPEGDLPPAPMLTPRRDPAPGSRPLSDSPGDIADGLLVAGADPVAPPPELSLVPAHNAAPQQAVAGPQDAIGSLIANVLDQRRVSQTADEPAAAELSFPRGLNQ